MESVSIMRMISDVPCLVIVVQVPFDDELFAMAWKDDGYFLVTWVCGYNPTRRKIGLGSNTYLIK